MENEIYLLNQLKQGNKEAFSLLFNTFYKDLVLFGGNFLPDRNVCEDIVQTLFLKLWKDGLLIFRDDPLSYVFKRLELTFNVNIIIKDVEIADALYRATFEKESLDEILRLLELTAPIEFEYTKRTQTADNHFDKLQIDVHKRMD
jgi:hypothetical protein